MEGLYAVTAAGKDKSIINSDNQPILGDYKYFRPLLIWQGDTA